MENDGIGSLELYQRAMSGGGVSLADMEALLDRVESELLLAGKSGLLNAAWNRCKLYFSTRHQFDRYEPASYRLAADLNSTNGVSALDGWMLIQMLCARVRGKDWQALYTQWSQATSKIALPPQADCKTLNEKLLFIDLYVSRERKTAQELQRSAGREAAEGADGPAESEA